MEMSNDEIRRRFRTMAGSMNKKARILADLNDCKPKDIISIIGESRTELFTPLEETVEHIYPQKQEAFEEGSVIYNLIVNRLEFLDATIREATREYQELSKYILTGGNEQ